MVDTYKVPVALIVFNRPTLAARVLAAIRQLKPTTLYVIADGPRTQCEGDSDRVARVRASIEEGVDWPCTIHRLFADENLGCARRVSSGLDAVFKRESEAVILEDDCLPDPSFFPFCAELLERYRDEPKVAHIAGTPCHWERVERPASYLFSRYGPIWGWATWRRAWDHYDLRLQTWPELRSSGWLNTMFSKREACLRRRIFDQLYKGNLHTWDYQWSAAKWRHGMLSIVPTRCMVENIGRDRDATHRQDLTRPTPRASPINFPLVHPEGLIRDEAFDVAWSKHFAPALIARIWRRLRPSSSSVDLVLQ